MTCYFMAGQGHWTCTHKHGVVSSELNVQQRCIVRHVRCDAMVMVVYNYNSGMYMIGGGREERE